MARIIRFRLARVAASLTLLCLLVLGAAPNLQAQSNQSASPKGLEGTWWVSVTQYDCATGVTRPSFVSLLAFARGGTMSETTANPAFQPGQRSSGFGIWTQASNGGYTSIDDAYILFTAGPFTRGTQRINHSIAVVDGGDHFNDEATVQFFDSTGALLVSGCARAVGTRMQ